MTYEEFKKKYNGLYVDWDGQYGPQCWDLAQQYVTECLGVPEWVLSGCRVAKNLLYGDKRNDLETYFYEVSVYEMNAGDLCIWDGVNDEDAGHIAIEDNWDGYDVWYFSQNPGPSIVQRIYLDGQMHAFRLRKEEPTPPPEVTPNVEPDEYVNQIEVLEGVTELNVRTTPSTEGQSIGKANKGYYNFYEVTSAEGYNWYKIADSQWIASKEGEWTKEHLAKEKEEYVTFKVLAKEDGYVLVDLGQVWIKQVDK